MISREFLIAKGQLDAETAINKRHKTKKDSVT